MGRAMVDVMIVNWNSGAQLADCLASIERCDQENLGRVIVVDNDSRDGSLEGLERWRLPLTVIRNASNRGFGAACNQAAGESRAEFLLFLNPDTLLTRDALTRSVTLLTRSERQSVGILGIRLLDDSGRVARSCARFATPAHFFIKMLGLDYLFPRFFHAHHMTEWDHGESREVDHVIGAFYLVRRVVFETLQGFDERFFVYLEDLDFSLRAHQAGWRSFYLTEVSAYHKGGGTSERAKAARLFYALRSRILYGYKHFNFWPATALLVGTLILEPLTRLCLATIRRSKAQMVETCLGYWMLWGSLPMLLRAVVSGLGVPPVRR